MKIKLLFIVCHVLFAPTIIVGQKAEKIRKPSPWDSMQFKNEISIDHSPILSVLISGTIPGGIPWSVAATYRRFFTKKDAFRFGYRSTFNGNNYASDPFGESISFRPIGPGRTDSVIVVRKQSYHSDQNAYHTLRPGYEHRFGNRRVKFVLGIDLMLGVEKSYQANDTSYYETIHPVDGSGGITHLAEPLSLIPVNKYSYEDVWAFVVGGSTVIGLNIHLSKRWSLNGTIIYELYGFFPFITATEPVHKVKPISKIGYQAPVADISLTYRF